MNQARAGRTKRRKQLRKLVPDARKQALEYGAEQQRIIDSEAHKMMLAAPNAMVCKAMRGMAVKPSQSLSGGKVEITDADYRKHKNAAKRARRKLAA